jgi:signal transduction histidine kinase
MALTRAEMTTEASNPIDVVSIVHQVAGDYASELSFELPEQNDVITALAPAATLSAALDTLFENAIEHGASKVNVNCAIGQQTVQIEVRDNGHGISQRNRPRIFDPFFTTRRDHGGTGLGLNIARTLVRQANGDLSLAEDEETTFVIHLPAKTPGN